MRSSSASLDLNWKVSSSLTVNQMEPGVNQEEDASVSLCFVEKPESPKLLQINPDII